MVNNVSTPLEAFLGYLRDCVTNYHIAEDVENESEQLTQDILHSLELEEHDDAEYTRMAQELVDARRTRREAKNQSKINAPVVEWVNANPAVIKTLERLLGAVRKAEQSTENRMYTPRVWKGIPSDSADETTQNGGVIS